MRSLGWLAAAAFIVACGGADSKSDSAAAANSADTAQGGEVAEHEHSAPHGGALIELGEEFAHLELVLDAGTGRLSAYVLDGEAEAAIRLDQGAIDISLTSVSYTAAGRPPLSGPVLLSLRGIPNELTGETERSTSYFAAEVEALRGATAFAGTAASVTVRGQTFTDVALRFPEGTEEKR